MAGRVLVFGDIHGQLTKLNNLLAQLQPTAEDELIFLGDYLDRGEDSWGVLKRVFLLAQKLPQVVCLKGNHEAIFFDRLSGQPDLVHLRQATTVPDYRGDTSIAELQRAAGEEPELMKQILGWMINLPVHYERRGVHFAHAGCNPVYPLTEQKESDFLWPRESFFERYHGEALWLIGHTPVQYLLGKDAAPYPLMRENNIIMLDTGAFLPQGRLSCMDLSSGKIYQA